MTAIRRYDIALARPDDLSHIAPIELAAARLLAGYAPEAVLEEITPNEDLQAAQRDGRLWVALSRDVPVGFAHVEILEPNAAHLEEIDVLPEHGRQGLGARLVREVCQWAETRGLRAVTLTTFRDVPWNMPFYARLGFEEVPPADLSPTLREVLADEARRGLDPTRRVAMRWRSPAAASQVRRARPTDHEAMVGSALVAHAQRLAVSSLEVDVNEQNEDAVGFYAALGFSVVGRSPTDTGGRPFPLLHMTRGPHSTTIHRDPA